MAGPMHSQALKAFLRVEFPDSRAEQSLILFKRQVLQRVPFDRIIWPLADVLGIYEVQQWIYGSLKNSTESERPSRYDKQFWKSLLQKVEDAVQGLEDPDIYDPLMDYCAEINSKPDLPEIEATQKEVCVEYTLPTEPDLMLGDTTVALVEKPNVLSGSGCTGHRTWAAALCLAYWLASDPKAKSYVKDKNILELGAGTGLVTFACAALGAKRIVATDGQQDAIDRLYHIATRNGYSSPSKSSALDFELYKWGEPLSDIILESEVDAFDTVLGADITYDPTEFSSLMSTICEILQSRERDTTVIIAATIRNEETHQSFVSELEARKLQCQEILSSPFEESTQLGLFHSNEIPIKIFRIFAKSDDS